MRGVGHHTASPGVGAQEWNAWLLSLVSLDICKYLLRLLSKTLKAWDVTIVLLGHEHHFFQTLVLLHGFSIDLSDFRVLLLLVEQKILVDQVLDLLLLLCHVLAFVVLQWWKDFRGI